MRLRSLLVPMETRGMSTDLETMKRNRQSDLSAGMNPKRDSDISRCALNFFGWALLRCSAAEDL
jgi:hypothetical protein